MKLGCASEGSITESKSYIKWSLIHEHETAPTWSFDYQKYRNDPSPKILLLGSYRHPVTGNDLIGGINLNYLSPRQKLKLKKELPRLLQAKNLYARYHLGLSLLPDVFDAFYRTYNPSYIRGIRQDVIIPNMPRDKAATDLIRHRIDKINKTKAQRQQEYMPRYPKDISDMEKNLKDKTDKILQRPAAEITPPDETEQRAAIVNKQEFNDREQNPEQIAVPALQQEIDREEDGYIAPEPDIVTKGELEADIEDETDETEEDLRQPDQEEDPLDMNESLIYYDPFLKRYIIEPAFSLVSEWKPKTR